MQENQWNFIDKSTWPDGEWKAEPDKLQWEDKATGLPCLLRRNRSGILCGYVGVTEGHPLFSVEYSQCPKSCGEEYCSHTPESTLDVHGGLTYSDFCVDEGKEHGICHIPSAGEPERVYWFGFDCNHSGDRIPSYQRFSSATEVYRNIGYVRDQCAQLTVQLKALA